MLPDDDKIEKSTSTSNFNVDDIKVNTEIPKQSSSPIFVIKRRKNSQVSMDGSIFSNNISIRTLEENECNSSVVESDTDDETFNPSQIQRCSNSDNNEIIIVDNSFETNDDAITNFNVNNDSKVNIGSIAVQNSSEITFGHKTYYQGPVTVKQFLYDKEKWRKVKNGEDNFAFDGASSAGGEQQNDLSKDCNKKTDSQEFKWSTMFKNRYILIAICSCIFVLVTTIFIARAFIQKGKIRRLGDGDDSRYNVPQQASLDIGNDLIKDPNYVPLRIVSRDEWLAQPPEAEINDLDLPVSRVIITHTETENCPSQAACTFRVRFIQTKNIESENLTDIKYNFLVGGDGNVYEGRGWRKEGAHTRGYNVDSLGIALIGTFNKVEPPEIQMKAAQNVMKEGILLRMLPRDYKLYGQRQLLPYLTSGNALYAVIQKWPNWTPTDKPPN